MSFIVKCRQCRSLVLETKFENILNAHGEARTVLTKVDTENTTCSSLLENNEMFLSEDNLPEWIVTAVETSEWTKGKLKCRNCDARIGSFDFVSGNRCNCQKSVQPSIHLVRSKLDCPNIFLQR